MVLLIERVKVCSNNYLLIIGSVHFVLSLAGDQEKERQLPVHDMTVDTAEAKLRQIANNYCHASLDGRVAGEEGESHITRREEGFELVQMNMLIRHGDRSPTTHLNLQPPVQYECGMINKHENWAGLDDFQIQPLPPLAKVVHRKVELFRGFNTLPCKVGQLTYRGFKQHHSIGSYMAAKYKALLNRGMDKSSIYLQSTDYGRTIHSAAAFGLGFLSSRPTVRKSIPIHVSSPGNSLLTEPPPGIPMTYPPCSNIARIRTSDLSRTNYERELKKWHESFDTVVGILGINKSHAPSITELYDHFWCRMCHNATLPCGKTTCINSTLAYQTALAAHWYYLHKFTNTTSIVSVQPFLFHTVFGKLDSAIKGISSNGPYHRFVISFAHDTTVNPFLRSLGFSVMYWVPYASRVVIELWRDTSQPPQLPRSYYVRLLFNGASLMAMIKHPAEDFRANGQLLNYAAWKEGLMKEQLRNIDSYKNICLARQPKSFL